MKRNCIENKIVNQRGGVEAKVLFPFLKEVDKDKYIHYLSKEYNWYAYFRYRKFTLQKYGYFVWKSNWRQILFQFMRPCRFITVKLYKVTASYPNDFFYHHYKWEKDNLLKGMIPRCREILEHVDEYREIYELLYDEESKKSLLYLIMGYLTLKYEYFSMARHEKEAVDYYPTDIFKDAPKNVIDCGGYTGDTASQFLKYYGQEVKKYYLFEPDEKNIIKARSNLESYSKNIVYVQAAVAENEGMTTFYANGAAGTIDKNGNERIRSVSLDSIVKEKIYFIKMDIEGSELMALKGARSHITKDAPDMAICAYHKPADIRELVKYIKTLVPSYKVYIRHYSDKEKETVLYFSIK